MANCAAMAARLDQSSTITTTEDGSPAAAPAGDIRGLRQVAMHNDQKLDGDAVGDAKMARQ